MSQPTTYRPPPPSERGKTELDVPDPPARRSVWAWRIPHDIPAWLKAGAVGVFMMLVLPIGKGIANQIEAGAAEKLARAKLDEARAAEMNARAKKLEAEADAAKVKAQLELEKLPDLKTLANRVAGMEGTVELVRKLQTQLATTDNNVRQLYPLLVNRPPPSDRLVPP